MDDLGDSEKNSEVVKELTASLDQVFASVGLRVILKTMTSQMRLLSMKYMNMDSAIWP